MAGCDGFGGPRVQRTPFYRRHWSGFGLDVSGQWADLGSGAGFPGIALAAVHAHAQITLAESRLKRATFLKRVIHTARLENATVHHGRTEDLADGQWDGVISRAYKPPELFMDDACRLLKPGVKPF